MSKVGLEVPPLNLHSLLAILKHQLKFLVLLEGSRTVRVNYVVCWVQGLEVKKS